MDIKIPFIVPRRRVKRIELWACVGVATCFSILFPASPPYLRPIRNALRRKSILASQVVSGGGQKRCRKPVGGIRIFVWARQLDTHTPLHGENYIFLKSALPLFLNYYYEAQLMAIRTALSLSNPFNSLLDSG